MVDWPENAMKKWVQARSISGIHWMGIGALIERNMLREWRFFSYAVAGPALQALLFTFVFVTAAGDHLPSYGAVSSLHFLAAGLILTASLQRAFEFTAYSLMFDKLEAAIEDILGSPFYALETILGFLASAMVFALLIGLSVWLVYIPFTGLIIPHAPLLLLITACMTTAIFALAGLVACVFSKRWDSLSAYENFLMMPMVFLSGSFFPLSFVPQDWQWVMIYNPVFHMINLFRYGLTGYMDYDLTISLCVTVVCLTVLLLAAWRLFATGYRLKP